MKEKKLGRFEDFRIEDLQENAKLNKAEEIIKQVNEDSNNNVKNVTFKENKEELNKQSDKDSITRSSTMENQENNKLEDEPEEKEEVDYGENPEMTEQDKQDMYEAVRTGDIDLLDDLLDKPGADINMVWFQENLLMAAIRAQQQDMAFFLVDNGVNINFSTLIMDIPDEELPRPYVDWYTVHCRQMAYDHDMVDLVQVIDEINGDLWPHIQPLVRQVRLKKTPEEKWLEKQRLEELEREEKELENGENNNAMDLEDLEVENLESVSQQGSVTGEDRPPYTEDHHEQDHLDPGGVHISDENNLFGDIDVGLLGFHKDLEMRRASILKNSTSKSSPRDPPPVGFRETRTFTARRKVNKNRVNFSEHIHLNLSPVNSQFHGSYGAESKRWASPRTQKDGFYRVMNYKEEKNRVSSATRTLSPWKDNDPLEEMSLKKRIKSARTNKDRDTNIPMDSPLMVRPKSNLPSLGRRKIQNNNYNGYGTVRNLPTYARSLPNSAKQHTGNVLNSKMTDRQGHSLYIDPRQEKQKIIIHPQTASHFGGYRCFSDRKLEKPNLPRYRSLPEFKVNHKNTCFPIKFATAVN